MVYAYSSDYREGEARDQISLGVLGQSTNTARSCIIIKRKGKRAT
jgi:hypothetical protein